MKHPITGEDQICNKCNTLVVWRTHKPNWKPKKNQPYYFKKWLYCPNCKSVYHLESEKVYLKNKGIITKRIDETIFPTDDGEVPW